MEIFIYQFLTEHKQSFACTLISRSFKNSMLLDVSSRFTIELSSCNHFPTNRLCSVRQFEVAEHLVSDLEALFVFMHSISAWFKTFSNPFRKPCATQICSSWCERAPLCSCIAFAWDDMPNDLTQGLRRDIQGNKNRSKRREIPMVRWRDVHMLVEFFRSLGRCRRCVLP